jgi:hypothetical protein
MRNLLPNRFSVEWSPAALAVFYKLSIQAATTIDQAVIQLAEMGQGHLEWVAPYFRLRVASFDLPLVLDRKTRTLTVIAVIRLYATRKN